MTERSTRTTNRTNKKFLLGRGDRTLFGVILGLVIFGSIMIFSGSVPVATAQELAPYHYFVKQVQFLIIGLVLFLITYNLDYHHYPKLAIPGVIFSLILLVVVFFTPEINFTHRWLDLGFTTVQVSDVAKLALIIYLASWLSKPLPEKYRGTELSKEKIKEYLKGHLGPFLLILSAYCALVVLQPDLSVTILIGIIAIGMYFIGASNVLQTLGTIGIGLTLALAGIAAGIIAPYRFGRITTFFKFITQGIDGLEQPFGRDYQIRQILIAVGTGGLTGQGFAQSKQKFSYLTETAFSDTIFAVYSEEFGFLGSILMVIIFTWIMYRGFNIAINAKDKLGMLLASGITIWITMQGFIHMAVNVGLIPLTGMPMPFLSYGGSSLVMTMIAIGVLLNVSRYSEKYA